MQLNLADYNRYLSEVTLISSIKETLIVETESSYEKFFTLTKQIGSISKVNPCCIIGHYHYSIFKYEILDKRDDAIHYLKNIVETIVDNLDDAYKYYVDVYSLWENIMETLTSWVIISNAREDLINN